MHNRGAAFSQYFEGSADARATVYERIRASSMHHDIIELRNATIDGQRFSGWQMGYTAITHSQWQELSKADWLAKCARLLRSQGPQPEGIRRLMAFWHAAVGTFE